MRVRKSIIAGVLVAATIAAGVESAAVASAAPRQADVVLTSFGPLLTPIITQEQDLTRAENFIRAVEAIQVNDTAMVDFNLGKCAGHLALAIGANAVFIAKVLKVKAAIKAIGGAANAIRILRNKVLRERKSIGDAMRETFDQAAAGAGALALEIFQLGGVAENCF
ncbi:hypothetical protein ACFVMC_23185 [Nocardia sp. NPDC127579]|uniref:hypothetical protein n=1 Tax=Nocardia sp. NPDC127579 TaxID=3345402 RepID=UPI00363E1439